jgi:uncharacterized damage-inducible protein DinB
MRNVAFILLLAAAANLHAQIQPRSRAEETLEWWNQIGNKLIALAKDFPEDKYDFKVQKDQRTFAQNLLHVAAIDYLLIGKVSGSKSGPDFGKDFENPSRDVYKTKADVVKLLEQAVAEGAALIKQQGDTGIDTAQSFGWETGTHVVRNSYIWLSGIEHSTEHFGQLVVYYRANNLVPPESRSIIASAIDREIADAEKQITAAAEAMPETKFNFSPDHLHIADADYKGVRTFAQQIRHIAASNYAIWSPLTGDQFPKDYLGGNGPENLTTKPAILKFLKDSFALGHKAASMLTLENMLQPPDHSKSTRLHLAVFAVEHAYDHYGQIVEYLRMNAIVPPATR